MSGSINIFGKKRGTAANFTNIFVIRESRIRSARGDNRVKITNKTSFEDHPEVIEDRELVGDREFDSIVGKGKKGAMVTLVDR
jgi:IS30 family transposase